MLEKEKVYCCNDIISAHKQEDFPLIFDEEKKGYFIFITDTANMLRLFYCPWCSTELVKKIDQANCPIEVEHNPLLENLAYYPANMPHTIAYTPPWLNKKWSGDEMAYEIYLD